jgi:hypothetical protein
MVVPIGHWRTFICQLRFIKIVDIMSVRVQDIQKIERAFPQVLAISQLRIDNAGWLRTLLTVGGEGPSSKMP